jgi:hypothetical protein
VGNREARTFRLETRSAVSSNVNCEIWSTIVAILGFDAVAAAVEFHRRDEGLLDVLDGWKEPIDAQRTDCEERRERVQHLAAVEERDIVDSG